MLYICQLLLSKPTCSVFVSEPLLFLLDEFNRVIIPVKRGEENTDYINASFIDVSKTRLTSASIYSQLTEIPLSEPWR